MDDYCTRQNTPVQTDTMSASCRWRSQWRTASHIIEYRRQCLEAGYGWVVGRRKEDQTWKTNSKWMKYFLCVCHQAAKDETTTGSPNGGTPNRQKAQDHVLSTHSCSLQERAGALHVGHRYEMKTAVHELARRLHVRKMITTTRTIATSKRYFSHGTLRGLLRTHIRTNENLTLSKQYRKE